jgi:hypothetical protein
MGTRTTSRIIAGRTLAPLAVAVLAACGGGDGSDTVAVSTTVLDGAIENATVCLDKNDNGACDAGEPTGKTNASGAVTLSVDKADAGKYPLLALVGTDAIDADHGHVTSPYALSTTADRPSLITPLTTLVKAQTDSGGLTTAEAEKSLQSRLSISTSLFDNYHATGGSESLATLARLLTLLTQQIYANVQSAVGTTDTSGGTITQQDLQRVMARYLTDQVQAVASALGAEDVRNAADAQALETALQSQAQALAADASADGAAAAVGASKQAAAATIPPQEAPAAHFSFRWFTYTDANNWFFRAFTQTLAQATPDANGETRFVDERKRAVAGVIQNWGDAPDFTQANVYWTGSQWFACPVSYEHISTPYDANGENRPPYADAFARNTAGRRRDVSGQSIAEVISQIRAYPGRDTQGSYSDWGPDPSLPALAGLSFPNGSALYYQTSIDVSNPVGYTPGASNVVTLVPQSSVDALAAGDQSPCSQAGALSNTIPAATLEAMVENMRGLYCYNTPTAQTGPRNEGFWGAMTVGLGADIDAPLPDGNAFYLPIRRLRVGFGSDNAVTYYRCLRRASDSATRNCDVIGTGTYTIETVGDGRTLRFSNLPVDTAQYNFERVFVERDGAVYYGSQSKLQVIGSLRLNTTASEALLTALGISR